MYALGVPESKIYLVYDWVDIDLIQPLPRDNSFSREFELVERFVILYAGNLGLSQGLELVLEAAKLLEGYPEIYFVFVGDGSGREFLVERSNQLRIHNLQFIAFQPRDRLPEVLASADISLVILRKGIGSESLPSKTFSILASGRPVLASLDPDSETWRLVERAGAGVCVPSEDPAALAEAILTLKHDQDLRERLGQNGRKWAERYHSPQAAASQFEKLFMQIIEGSSTPKSLLISE
jgi:colanic acid biosynthesis glycosyl transferase WcaI